jgi:phospholipid-binding lipoprotein MlaA
MLQNKVKSLSRIFIVLLMVTAVSACAGKTYESDYAAYRDAESTNIPDPLEPLNRGIFKLNTALDIVLLEPLAMGYNALLPEIVRNGIRNFLRNLRAPIHIANNILQGEVGDASVGAARFVMNTTVGVGGVFDVAATQGLNYEQEDFGQTLAVWGVGDGFYIVWPVFGPSSVRDSVGFGVDALADPVRIVAFNADEEWIYYTRNGIEFLDAKASLVDTLRDVRKNSLDYYSSVKTIYEQRRTALIRDNIYKDTYNMNNGYDEYSAYDNYDQYEHDQYK